MTIEAVDELPGTLDLSEYTMAELLELASADDSALGHAVRRLVDDIERDAEGADDRKVCAFNSAI